MKWKCKMFVCLFANHLNASNIERGSLIKNKKKGNIRQMMAGWKKKNGKLRKSLEEMFEIFQCSQRAAPKEPGEIVAKLCLNQKSQQRQKKRALQATNKKKRKEQKRTTVLGQPLCPGYPGCPGCILGYPGDIRGGGAR